MNVKSKNSLLCTTGVEGLDEILSGGLPRHRIYLIQGDPGAGKTTLALQFLLEGCRNNEPGLYITLSETKEELEAVAESHGWSLAPIHLLDLASIQEAVNAESESTFFRPSEIELNRTTKVILAEVERVKPLRVVFDSLSEMRLLAESSLRYRRQILHLKQGLTGSHCTALFLEDRSHEDPGFQIESIVHGVLALHRASPHFGVSRRHLNVEKLRGVKYREGNHDFIIQKGGLAIFPRLIAAEHAGRFKRERLPSGIKELDDLLGGGLDRGTSNMFMGPPGTGKSTLAMLFARVASLRGEKVSFFIFDETRATLLARANHLGMDLEPYITKGTLQITQIDPAELSPGELTHRIRRAVMEDNTRMIIIDSINGYLNAMPEERYLILQLHELFAFLNQQGVISIMILAQHGLIGTMQSSVDLSYLADSILLVRFFESLGILKQSLSIIKKRSGYHERTIREFHLGADGIQVGQPLKELQGVLTGVPSFREVQ